MQVRRVRSIAIFCAVWVSALQVQAMSSIHAPRLRCEYRVEPLGIDTPGPRVSWTVSSEVRGQAQTAYRVLVADSPDALKAGRGTLWDTGKVQSDETIGVVYGGKPLASLMRYYWKVKVWDKDGAESAWSETAMWQTGLLSEGDWKAQWVGMDNRPVNLALGSSADSDVLKDCRWIWTPGEGDPAQAVPAGVRYFRKTFDLKDGAKVQQATLYIAADNSAQVFVNGTSLNARVGYSMRCRWIFRMRSGPVRMCLPLRRA
jgi:alpha-L-rhamnosidase